MDFGTLLTVAQKNGASKQQVACYQTKFTPPKKATKTSRNLSDNIKKFLAKKEEEEKQKSIDAKKKRDNLLALRDHKAQSRINKHLKVCKAANKSVLADAIDNDNTAVTMAGPSQPDEDDYGYVSQEASAFYNQLMNKYKSLPAEKPLFSESGKKTVKDIASTKDRVRQALKQQEIEEMSGHRRKRKSHSANGETEGTTEVEAKPDKERAKEATNDKGDREKEDKPKVKKRPPPPPMDFMKLLQIAEKKQYEPINLDVRPKPTKVEEPERLMTKKQMREHQKEKEWREKKEQRERNSDAPKVSSSSPVNGVKSSKQSSMNRIPKLNAKPTSATTEKSKQSPVTKKPGDKNSSTSQPSMNEKDALLQERKKIEAEKRMLEEMRRSIEEEKKKLAQSKMRKLEEQKSTNGSNNKSLDRNNHRGSEKIANKETRKPVSKSDNKPKQLSPTDAKPRQFPPTDVKPKQFPPADVKPRQFPPPDVKSSKLIRQFPPKDVKRKPAMKKRRIYDDDEDEYDSELDDFIDDGPDDSSENYSKYISEIFGYDKSKYQDYEDDDAAMESNFAQQLKEEYVSTKIGIMEDLEDIRMEAMEKKRKALMKNKKSRSS